MKKVKPSELKRLVDIHYKTKIPLFVYGGFGIGKSAIVRAEAEKLAKDKGKEFVDWGNTTKEKKLELLENPKDKFVLIDERLSQFEPSDIKGLPKFDTTKSYQEWVIPLWLDFLTKSDADGILFFDELNLAPPSVQASCYQLFHDREANEQKLSKDILIIGCGNRIEDKGHTYDIPLPLRDRKSEVELVIDSDEWFKWALENGIETDIVSFLKFRNDYLLKVNDDRQNKSATPRGWERTSKLIIQAKNDDELKTLVSVSVGEGIAGEYLAFTKLQNTIDLDELLDNPERVKSVEGLDLKYSLLSGLSQKFSKDKKLLGKCLGVMKELDAEFGVLLMRFMLSSGRQYIKNHIEKEKIWTNDLGNEYGKYLI